MMLDYLTERGLIDPKAVVFLTTDDKGKVDFLLAVPPSSVESVDIMKKMIRIWLDYIAEEKSAKFWATFGAVSNREAGLPKVPTATPKKPAERTAKE